jgi:hypothetical protein
MLVMVTAFDRSKMRVRGMQLDCRFELMFEVVPFTLWRYSSGWSRVTCQFRTIESMGSGADSEGRPITFVNDEAVRADPSLVGRELDFDVHETMGESPPFLLLPEKAAIPHACTARVRLHFSRLSEVPDIEGAYQLSDIFSKQRLRDTCSDFPEFQEWMRPLPRETNARWAKAHATAPSVGHWLPFDSDRIHGAMQLRESRGDGVFDAKLLLDRDIDAIQPGCVLRRRVAWTSFEGGESIAEADIATVLELH